MKYLLILIAVFSFQVNAKSLSSADEAQKLAESVMKDVGVGKMKEGDLSPSLVPLTR